MKISKSGTRLALTGLGILILSACAGQRDAGTKPIAKADVSGYAPNTVRGSAVFIPAGQAGMRIQGDFQGLLPNRKYAIHIHEMGSCATPEASGSHFDPGGSNLHGSPGGSPGANHAGDLPNLETDENGVGSLSFTTNALGAGTSDFSVIGRSIVIHSDQDDFQSQPAGGAGEKIACGVIQPSDG